MTGSQVDPPDAMTPEEASKKLFGKIGADGWLLYQELMKRLVAAEWLTMETVDLGEPDLVFGALDRALNAARVAVVRPTRPTREEIATMIEGAERARPRERWALTAADDILDASIGAVVRPTRDHAIATLLETEVWPLEWSYEDCRTAAERFADALIREFGVAVSDSQETPTEGREE